MERSRGKSPIRVNWKPTCCSRPRRASRPSKTAGTAASRISATRYCTTESSGRSFHVSDGLGESAADRDPPERGQFGPVRHETDDGDAGQPRPEQLNSLININCELAAGLLGGQPSPLRSRSVSRNVRQGYLVLVFLSLAVFCAACNCSTLVRKLFTTLLSAAISVLAALSFCRA